MTKKTVKTSKNEQKRAKTSKKFFLKNVIILHHDLLRQTPESIKHLRKMKKCKKCNKSQKSVFKNCEYVLYSV